MSAVAKRGRQGHRSSKELAEGGYFPAARSRTALTQAKIGLIIVCIKGHFLSLYAD